MKQVWRALALLVLAAALWPEVARYGAEWQLSAANADLDGILRGQLRDARGVQAAQHALAAAEAAGQVLPEDPRPSLTRGIALILLARGDDAVRVFEAAIAQGERPEFTLNLGRARTALGDTAGADAAYLRTAWASPTALSTLPKDMRDDLTARTAALEAQLHAGTLNQVPPLR